MSLLRRVKASLGHRHPLRLAWHRLKAFLAAARYGFPARKLVIIGVTGTDGKTSTVAMIAHILLQAGVTTGALSTAFFRINESVVWNVTQKTSPSPFVIQKFLRRVVRAGCTHAVLEYSSHGLVQGRTLCTWPRIAGITNTAFEHLDYHGTMEQYRADKGRLFRMLQGKGTKVLNADDVTAQLYQQIASEQTVFYSTKKEPEMRKDTQTLWLRDTIIKSDGSGAILEARGVVELTLPLALSIAGGFHLENALCAIGCTWGAGVPLERSVEALHSFSGVPGRLERIDEGQNYHVFVDFTVTPQAFEKTLTTLRQTLQGGRLLVLTGSCGDRMKEKRPMIAKICSALADVVVITEDESYGENMESIVEELWSNVDQSATEAHKIMDREEAIRFVIDAARDGDTVLLCGMGSYPSRMTPQGQVPWNEQDIARKALARRMRRS